MEKKITFEQAIKELELIVRKLENGEEALDSSLGLFERGVYLTKFCMETLEKAEQKVSILIKKDGKILEAPFDEDSEEKDEDK